MHERDKSGQALGAKAPDGVELGRCVQAGLIGLDQPQQPVALEIALARHEVVVSDDRRLARRIPDRGSPRPRQHRGLDRGGGEVAGLDHVVEQPPRAVQRALPEDRVAAEPVPARGGEQRLQLPARALAVESAPHDRVEAGVPVPLPRVADGARARVGVRHAAPLTLRPAGREHPFAQALELGHSSVTR